MDHLQFSNYHNRFITFLYRGEILRGVVLDNWTYKKPEEKWGYFFIPLGILRKWELAKESGNKILTRNLMYRVEIAEINRAKIGIHR